MKVVLELLDMPDGTVRTTCTPSFKQMAQATVGGHADSKAYGLAIKLANVLIDASRNARKSSILRSPIILPALKPGRMQ